MAMKFFVVSVLSLAGLASAENKNGLRGLGAGRELKVTHRSLDEFVEANSEFPTDAFVSVNPRDPQIAVGYDISGGFAALFCEDNKFGTEVKGTILEKVLKDGTATIEFNLRITNAWSSVAEWSDEGRPVDFPVYLYGTKFVADVCDDPIGASLASATVYYRIHVDEPGQPLPSYIFSFQNGLVEFLNSEMRAETPTGAKVFVHKLVLADNPNCEDDDKVPPPFINLEDNIYEGLVCEPVGEVRVEE